MKTYIENGLFILINLRITAVIIDKVYKTKNELTIKVGIFFLNDMSVIAIIQGIIKMTSVIIQKYNVFP